jgi:hypothetical protein
MGELPPGGKTYLHYRLCYFAVDTAQFVLPSRFEAVSFLNDQCSLEPKPSKANMTARSS